MIERITFPHTVELKVKSFHADWEALTKLLGPRYSLTAPAPRPKPPSALTLFLACLWRRS